MPPHNQIARQQHLARTLPNEEYRPAFPSSPKPYISYGAPYELACANHLENTFHSSMVYIIVSNSISKTENFTKLKDALGSKVVGVRKGIKPHTPWDDVLEIVKEVKEKEANAIVTLGAGSLTDGAKIIVLAVANNVSTHEDLESLSQSKDLKDATIPIINIPTSLSGGEYSSFAGATDTRTSHKVAFSHPSMGSSLVILSPSLSISTPERIWLSTGMRAIDHCVEVLCSLDPSASSKSDESATEGLKMLVPSLLKTKEKWEDEDARLKSMLGALKAMEAASTGVPMGGSHGIGHQLGPLGVGHGETSCVMLPSVLKYNYKHGDEKVRENQKKVLKVLWGEETVKEKLERMGVSEEADAGEVVGKIVEALEMPRSLKEVGVGKDQLDDLAENCLKDRWLKTNPVPLTKKEQVLEVLQMALGEEKGQ